MYVVLDVDKYGIPFVVMVCSSYEEAEKYMENRIKQGHDKCTFELI